MSHRLLHTVRKLSRLADCLVFSAFACCCSPRGGTGDSAAGALSAGEALALEPIEVEKCAKDLAPDWPTSWQMQVVSPPEDCVEYVSRGQEGAASLHLSLCPSWFPLWEGHGTGSRLRDVELGDRAIQCRTRAARGKGGWHAQVGDLQCRVEFYSDSMSPVVWVDLRNSNAEFARQVLRFLAGVRLVDCHGVGSWGCPVCLTGERMFLESRAEIETDALLGEGTHE